MVGNQANHGKGKAELVSSVPKIKVSEIEQIITVVS